MPPEPFDCRQLAERGLWNADLCCQLCHDHPLEGETVPVVIPLPEGDLHAEVCCEAGAAMLAGRTAPTPALARPVAPWCVEVGA